MKITMRLLGHTSFILSAISLLVIVLNLVGFDIPLIKYFLLFSPRYLFVFLALFSLCFFKKYGFIKKSVLLIFCIVTIFHLSFTIPAFNESEDTHNSNQIFSVVSLNMGGSGSLDKLALLNRFYQPDILFLQESKESDLVAISHSYIESDCDSGLCIASKFPFKKVGSLDRKLFGGWGKFAAFYEVSVGNNFLNVANVHFETPRHAIKKLIKNFSSSRAFVDVDEDRRLEASLVSTYMEKRDNVIIVGDLNMPVDEDIYKESFSRFQNALSDFSWGFNFTKQVKWRGIFLYGMRIDHILASKDLMIKDAKILESVDSDHLPLISYMQVSNED